MKPTVEPKEKLSGLLQKTADFSKKTAEKTVDFGKKAAEKTVDISKKVADNVQENAKALSEKSKDEAYLRKLKKYNPLFPDQYFSPEFNRPNMIVIVDDAVRKGVDVCEGAIGWLSNSNGMEVLSLYDEAVELSGIRFVPSAICDAAYYVDAFDRNRYIQVEKFFSKAHEEKLAELEHIAYVLGAKSCSIELIEQQAESHAKSYSHSVFIGAKALSKGKEHVENSSSEMNLSKRSGRKTSNFQGHDTPKIPELKWFQHDDNIKRLIEMRCLDVNSIRSTTLELEGTASSTMSLKTACDIDGTLKAINMKASANMEKRANMESYSKLLFIVEF